MSTDWPTGWGPGGIGAFAALKSEIETINVAPAIAYRVNNQVSVGASIQFQNIKGNLTSNPFGSYTDLEGDDLGFGFGLSALYEYNEQGRIGINYRSSVFHELTGTILSDPPGPPPSTLTPIRAKISTPDTLNIGIYHEVSPQLALMSDVSWTNWSRLASLDVYHATLPLLIDSTPFNWEDTLAVSVGATYKYSDAIRLHGGLAYDKNPTNDFDRTARLPDSDRYWVAAGVGYSGIENMDLFLGYTHIFADKTSMGTIPRNFGLTGNFEGSVDIITANLTYRF